jgi:hypothetical protein
MQPNVPTISPAQSAFVFTIIGLILLAFVCMLILKVAIYLAEKRAGVTYQWEPPEATTLSPFRAWAVRQEQRYTPRRYVVLSSWEGDAAVRDEDRTSSEDENTSSPDPVLPHQPQPEPDSLSVREPEREPSSLRNLTRAEEIALLTVQRNDDGSYRHSANKIAELMGGTAADVKSQVAAIRGPAKPAAKPTGHVARPPDGWPVKAS